MSFFATLPLPYKTVLADEVQDFTANELRLLRTIAPEGPNTLFVVGDGHQRIYGQQTRLGSCGIEIRGRSRRLKLNYRTTEQIRNQAVAILEDRKIDDLDGGLDTLKGYRSLRFGPAPVVKIFEKDSDEATFVVKQVRAWSEAGVRPETVCIAARTNVQIDDRYSPLLSTAMIPHVMVKRNPESEAKKPGIRIATMHRLKGLEFAKVILVGVQEGQMPLVFWGSIRI